MQDTPHAAMQEACKMAGRLAAHAVLSVSDGELLVPIYGYLTGDGQTRMVRLASDTAQEAMEEGQQMYAGNRYDAAAGFWAVDGFITLPEVGKVDALLINICTYAQPRQELRMAIPYRHAQSSGGFAVFKPKLLGIENLQKGDLQVLMDAFYRGRDEHAQAAPVWKAHHQDVMASVSGFGGMSAQDWAHVRDAPLAVFFMVAGADGAVDHKEVEAASALFKESGKYPSVLMQRVMSELTPHTPQGQALWADFMQRYASEDFSGVMYLVSLTGLLGQMADKGLAVAFRDDLLAFGHAVASSSGGGFLGLGSKISKEEKAMLAAITHTLSRLG
ncbi:MAG: hypothetical protein EOO33_17685 [Comamonadaceae bacterium]|nr:MAG: hypothetical protein EOO33_17685 [Comamonadaceae bacterium]